MTAIIGLILVFSINQKILFDFKENKDFRNWLIVNDNVMGGVSSSKLELDGNGNAVFSGSVSLANNGGFCSVRYNFDGVALENHKHIVLRIKGDGKKYQFRIRHNSNDYYSYITYFQTTEDWQTVELKLSEFYPSFRGRKLDMENFNKSSIEEIAFLIGNNREEKFRLEIDTIVLK